MPRQIIEQNVPSDRCGLTVSYLDKEFWARGDVCCWRSTWKDHDRCIWHSKVDHKHLLELQEHINTSGIRLDCSHLPNLDAEELLSIFDRILDGSSLPNLSAKNVDISNSHLNSTNLYNSSFAGSTLSNCGLREANLSEADLSNANLDNAHLRKAQIVDSDLSNATLCCSTAFDTKFHSTDLSGSDFTSANLEGAYFTGITGENSDFSEVVAANSDFFEAALGKSNFKGSTLTEVNFQNTSFKRSDFTNSDISHASFANCNGVDAIFNSINALNCDFSNSNLAYADFSNSHLRYADFRESQLMNTDYGNSNCQQSNFKSSNLREANLSDCDLSRSDLSDTLLEDANLNNSDLQNTDLKRHKIAGTTFDRAVVNEDTIIGPSKYNSTDHSKLITSYKKIQRLLRDNHLDYLIIRYRIKEMNCKKRRFKKESQYFSWIIYGLLYHISGYGERPKKVIYSSLLLIAAISAIGTVSSAVSPVGDEILMRYLPFRITILLSSIIGGIYFGMTAFSGANPQNIEFNAVLHLVFVTSSLFGTVLVTIFIFTVGRIATRY